MGYWGRCLGDWRWVSRSLVGGVPLLSPAASGLMVAAHDGLNRASRLAASRA